MHLGFYVFVIIHFFFLFKEHAGSSYACVCVCARVYMHASAEGMGCVGCIMHVKQLHYFVQ